MGETVELYIARDTEGRWGMAIGIYPPRESQYKRYDLNTAEINFGIAKAYRLVSECAAERKSWDEVQLPDRLI